MNNLFIDAYLKIITESRKDDYAQQLENKGVENASEMADLIFQYNNPKKEKAALYWLLKGTIKLPEDQYKVDKAFNLIDKQHLDFQKFDNPMSVINRDDKSTKRINAQDTKFDPDKEPTFSNKKELGDGVVVYQVEDSKEGQLAVRKAIDVNWGYDKNPWCLAARKSGFDQDEIAQLSEEQREKLGLYSDDELAVAWKYWSEIYTAYPKRIAFKNGKLLAFCANNKGEIAWWDKNDASTVEIPETKIQDDLKFVKKYIRNFNVYLAQNPNTPSEVLVKLADDEKLNVRHFIAKNQNTPAEVLLKLANDKDDSVRGFVAYNKNCPTKLLEKLANDENHYVRYNVAKNQNTPAEVLLKLANDEKSDIRACVANNQNTSAEVLLKLANDEYWVVKRAVAQRQNTPLKILEKLAVDEYDIVRWDVARNENTPKEVLLKLVKDEDKDVRDAAEEALKRK